MFEFYYTAIQLEHQLQNNLHTYLPQFVHFMILLPHLCFLYSPILKLLKYHHTNIRLLVLTPTKLYKIQ